VNIVWIVKVNNAIYEVVGDHARAKVMAWDLIQEDPQRNVTITRWTVL
jgi:hypothetical protein